MDRVWLKNNGQVITGNGGQVIVCDQCPCIFGDTHITISGYGFDPGWSTLTNRWIGPQEYTFYMKMSADTFALNMMLGVGMEPEVTNPFDGEGGGLRASLDPDAGTNLPKLKLEEFLVCTYGEYDVTTYHSDPPMQSGLLRNNNDEYHPYGTLEDYRQVKKVCAYNKEIPSDYQNAIRYYLQDGMYLGDEIYFSQYVTEDKWIPAWPICWTGFYTERKTNERSKGRFTSYSEKIGYPAGMDIWSYSWYDDPQEIWNGGLCFNYWDEPYGFLINPAGNEALSGRWTQQQDQLLWDQLLAKQWEYQIYDPNIGEYVDKSGAFNGLLLNDQGLGTGWSNNFFYPVTTKYAISNFKLTDNDGYVKRPVGECEIEISSNSGVIIPSSIDDMDFNEYDIGKGKVETVGGRRYFKRTWIKVE